MTPPIGPTTGSKMLFLVSAVFILMMVFGGFSRQFGIDTKMEELMNKELSDVEHHMPSEPVCKDCIEPNPSLSNLTAVFGNYVFPEPNCDRKLLVYECAGGLCGGLGDREKGIMSAFLLALVTGRTFIIDHRKPCDIKKFLEPNLYDWSKCLPSVGKARSKGHRTIHYIDGRGNLPSDFSPLKLGDIWPEHVITIHVNIRLQPRVKNHPSAPQMMPWLIDSSPESVITGLMHALFKPEKTLENHLQQFITEQTRNGTKQFVAVHIRAAFLKLDSDIPIVFKFLEQYSDKNKYSLYVASDKLEIRNQAMQRFKNFASVNREIVHIDQFNKPCEGVYTAVFEQQILSRGDILVMTRSGFSRMAAYIRGSSENVFYLVETKHDDSESTHFEKIGLDFLPKTFPDS